MIVRLFWSLDCTWMPITKPPLLQGLNATDINYPLHFHTWVVTDTRRWSPLRGPTSGSCGGLRPSAEAFFALRTKKAYYAVLVHFWCPVVTLVTLKKILKKNPKKSKQIKEKLKKTKFVKIQKIQTSFNKIPRKKEKKKKNWIGQKNTLKNPNESKNCQNDQKI